MFKILIADDEQIEREALRYIISRSIEEIRDIEEAVNGREAISKVQASKPDIVILDINMPGINGIEAAWKIREKDPDVVIIFLTAFHQFDYAHEAIKVGVEDYIIKPSSEAKIIEVIEKVISKLDKRKKTIVEREDIELRLDRATDYLESEFIYNLATRYINEDKFSNYLTLLNIEFHEGRGLIMKIDYNSYPIDISLDYQKRILRQKCSRIVSHILLQNGIKSSSNIEHSSVYLFLYTREQNRVFEDDHNIDKILVEVVEEIKKNINVDVVIGLGGVFTGSEGSILSFSEAKTAMSRLKQWNIHNDITDDLPIELEINMEQAIINGDREKIEQFFIPLERWLQLSSGSISEKVKRITSLISVFIFAANKQFPEGEHLFYTEDISHAVTVSELTTSLKLLINQITESIKQLNSQESSPAIRKACEYIRENYHKNITLEETASYCNLSSFYFSKVFKSETNENFINYLTNIRVEKSKELLRDTQLSVKEITMKIGYNDPNYFTRVFKKIESYSPTDYRNRRH